MKRASFSRRQVLQLSAVVMALQHLPLWAETPQGTQVGRPAAVALLVGNTSYNPNEEDLPPAHKCLVDLDARLQRLGFRTVLLHDPALSQVRDELDNMRRVVKVEPETTAVFYFVGHGFQSNAENYLVPAGGNLNASSDELSQHCLSVERDVFSRLERSAGPAATVIMIDACRTVDRPRSAQEGHNQTMPPEGCHVAFATGPGQRAFAPADPQRYTFFAEALVAELDLSHPSRSVLTTLEGVCARVERKVNSIETIMQAFGENAQQPELASNVIGDPTWILTIDGTTMLAADILGMRAPPVKITLPDAVITRLKTMGMDPDLRDNPEATAIAQARLDKLARAESAARSARLELDQRRFVAGLSPRAGEEARRALQGDKYAALRVAEALPRPAPGELIERSDYGRWMAFAAYLGNGIAAYQLSLYFRNVDHRDAEAARYLKLARAAHYTPPRQLDPSR